MTSTPPHHNHTHTHNSPKPALMKSKANYMAEYELEMERLLMEREDKLSYEIEIYTHKLKFIQKDM
jgi:hypothetical protein